MTNLNAESKNTQAQTALEFVLQLFEDGTMCDRFDEIVDADPESTSDDLCYIVFLDSSAITINPGAKTVEIA